MMNDNHSTCGKGGACRKTVTLCGMCTHYENVSNIHYGAVGARHFDNFDLRLGAGFAQVMDNHGPRELWRMLNQNLGDESGDRWAIETGFLLAERYGSLSKHEWCSVVTSKRFLMKQVGCWCDPCSSPGQPNVQTVTNIADYYTEPTVERRALWETWQVFRKYMDQ